MEALPEEGKDEGEAHEEEGQQEEEQQPPAAQKAPAELRKGEKHFFDSIETEEFVMPPKFEVEIRLPDNEIHIVTVEVEKATRPKPYLGGYRNNRTNLVYHHAFAQTD